MSSASLQDGGDSYLWDRELVVPPVRLVVLVEEWLRLARLLYRSIFLDGDLPRRRTYSVRAFALRKRELHLLSRRVLPTTDIIPKMVPNQHVRINS